jgi:hypothetical protein
MSKLKAAFSVIALSAYFAYGAVKAFLPSIQKNSLSQQDNINR